MRLGTSWQRLLRRVLQTQDEAALIRRLLADLRPSVQHRAVFVETGCGGATCALAEVAERVGAVLYCCELDPARIESVRARGGAALENVQFLPGDSLETLPKIAARHERIDFALLGSAPSATHTLREFFALEARLGPGARLLVDEAALPGARLTLGPCRKGALLVPYLLASPVWRVTAHPRAGESMVSAAYDRVGARADSRYEDPRLAESWRTAPV
jgi:SAM-dependent methyltransferase